MEFFASVTASEFSKERNKVSIYKTNIYANEPFFTGK